MTPSQLRSLHDYLEAPPDMLVVDLREERPAACWYHARAWARGGFRRTAIPGVADSRELLVLTVRQASVPWAILLSGRPGGASTAQHQELLAELFTVSGVETVHVDGPVIYADGFPLEDGAHIEDDGFSTTVVLLGDRELRLSARDLPLALRVELPSADRLVPMFGLQLFQGNRELLPEAWFSVRGPPSGRLTIDLRPKRTRAGWKDTLQLTYERGSERGRVQQSRNPKSAERPTRPVQRLALILDRTCPDASAWSAARRVFLGTAAEFAEADSYTIPQSQEAAAPSLAGHGALNRAIRSALAAGFNAWAASREVECDVWWVSDTAGSHVVAPSGVTLPREPVVYAGSTGSSGAAIAQRLEGATWTPGLDLWDPIERALAAAARGLREDDRRGAVLIVGNSPPNPLLLHDDPFWDVARVFGYTTSLRRPHTPTWKLELDRCRQEGLPVAYLFLEHPLFEDEEERPIHEMFQKVQTAVRAALQRYLPVVTAAADEASVAAGLYEALQRLETPDVAIPYVRFGEEIPPDESYP